MEYQAKALGTGTNSGAELSEVYDPVVQNTLNNEVNFYNLVQKEAGSGVKPKFRARTGRNNTAGYYAENDTINTGSQTRVSLYGEWKQYKVGVEVTGLMMETARASAGELANIYDTEIREATEDLMVELSTDMFGTGAEQTSGVAMAGLKRLIDDGTNYATLYGETRTGSDWTSSGYDETSEGISISRMRSMVKTVTENGARRGDLRFVASPTQVAKYKDHIQNLQVLQPNANVVGFGEVPAMDNIPIIEAQHCDDDYLYLIDMSVLKIMELKSPTLKPLPSNKDSDAAFIRTYLELICKAPNHCYKKINLTT